VPQPVPLKAPNGDVIGVAEVSWAVAEDGVRILVDVSGMKITSTEWREKLQDAVTNTSAFSVEAVTDWKLITSSPVGGSILNMDAGITLVI
jgi:hypothetical protein